MNKEEISDNADTSGNIWITSRTRMESHARFKRYDLFSHLVLTIYSVTLLGFSVFGAKLESTLLGPYLSEISIVFSICVLSASLVIWGLRFGQTANEHKECYLALQKLYALKNADSEKQGTYQDILSKFPNHSEFDYNNMLFKKILMGNEKIRGTYGLVEFGALKTIRHIFWIGVRLFTFVFLMFAPLIFLAVLYVIAK